MKGVIMTSTSTGVTTFEAPSNAEEGLDPDLMRQMLETMLIARAVDERMWILNRSGQAPFAISGQGQEAAQAGLAYALDRDKDWLVPYYRDAALVLGFGMTAKDLMLGMLARADDPASGGRQMPNHFGHKDLRILSGSSPIATQIPHATGIAYASQLRGEDVVTAVSFGEGATSEGDFQEALNFAVIHQLPVVFFCQNNGYAISVPNKLQMGVEHVADRAKGNNLPGVRVNGLDAVETYLACVEAVDRARRGDGPTLIEAVVRRFNPHSSDDDDRTYRSKDELDHLRDDGPIRATTQRLREMGVVDDEWEADAKERVKALVNQAHEEAEQADLPDPSTLAKHVYAEDG